jgi:hypothetical protein
MPKLTEGTWAKDDLRRAFVEGAAWWEYHKTGFTMWTADRRVAEAEAERRYIRAGSKETFLDAFIAFIRRA